MLAGTSKQLPKPGFWDEPEGSKDPIILLYEKEGMRSLPEEQQVLFANFKKRFQYALQKSFTGVKEVDILKCFLSLPSDIQQTFTEAPVSIPAMSIADEIVLRGGGQENNRDWRL